jgi:hypothetical protein
MVKDAHEVMDGSIEGFDICGDVVVLQVVYQESVFFGDGFVVFIEDVGSGLKKQAAIIGVGVQFQPHFQNL